MKARLLMIQGTASNVGKSVVTAAICRILKRKGYRVAPFKAQNMSNNSFVTPEGGEISRAQAVQAEACGIAASVFMNPVLLKPESDQKAQIIVMGKPDGKLSSMAGKSYHKKMMPVVLDALERLRSKHDVVVMEGAGSPVEVNLRRNDIVNMNLATAVDAPVILVGDIDWGGIFSQLVGTFQLLKRDEKKRIRAFLINKFRGDKKILDPGLRWIETKTKRKILGVLPFISDLGLAEEDSISSDSGTRYAGLRANSRLDWISGKQRDRRDIIAAPGQLHIDVLWLPRISNFTDFDPLKNQTDVLLRYLHEAPSTRFLPDLIIIPGSKSTIADLEFLERSKLADYVRRASKAGVPVLGICGGYQMLGEMIFDKDGVESNHRKIKGLGLLPVATHFEKGKKTFQVTAKHLESDLDIRGYEIHMGVTSARKKLKPMFEILQRNGRKISAAEDGAVLPDKSYPHHPPVMGTYLHGLFDNAAYTSYFLSQVRQWSGQKAGAPKFSQAIPANEKTNVYDRLADIVEKHIHMPFLEDILHAQR